MFVFWKNYLRFLLIGANDVFQGAIICCQALVINIYIYQVLWTKYRSHIVDISELKPEKNYLFVEKKFFSGIPIISWKFKKTRKKSGNSDN